MVSDASSSAEKHETNAGEEVRAKGVTCKTTVITVASDLCMSDDVRAEHDLPELHSNNWP
jgi:hypothetical protein